MPGDSLLYDCIGAGFAAAIVPRRDISVALRDIAAAAAVVHDLQEKAVRFLRERFLALYDSRGQECNRAGGRFAIVRRVGLGAVERSMGLLAERVRRRIDCR